MRRPTTLTALALLALAGCNRHGSAGGETDSAVAVLPGSASDAMIPYDTLRSQPPKAAELGAAKPGKAGAAARSSDAAEPGTEPSAAAEASPPAAPSIAAPPPPAP